MEQIRADRVVDLSGRCAAVDLNKEQQSGTTAKIAKMAKEEPIKKKGKLLFRP